jgi:hypothetical protein
MTGGALAALVVGGDQPYRVTGTEADGVEETGIGVAGTEEALERLGDACGDGGVEVVRLGHVSGSDRLRAGQHCARLWRPATGRFALGAGVFCAQPLPGGAVRVLA